MSTVMKAAIMSLLCGLATQGAAPRPNIIFILTDDLGYGDVGALFQNTRQETGRPALRTPNIDRLAGEGMTFTQHYTSAPVCAPARASLMTGRHQGHCGLRDNNFDRPLDPGSLTLASVLRQGGYATYAVGKWGIGGGGESKFPETSMPRQVGFDHFYGYKMHRHGHTYYHDARSQIFDDDAPQDVRHIYDTDLFTARTKKYITDHRAATPEKPFFVYLAYTAIHGSYGQWLDDAITEKTPFQVPGRPYPEGGVAWPLQPETPSDCNTWLHPDYAAREGWTIPMKRYATSVRRLDDALGDLLAFLRAQGLADDTLVVFTSDNGPAQENTSDPKHFDSWGPFRGFKRDCTEGGIRVPTFAWAPGRVPAGTVNATPSSFPDWMPTLAALAGLPPPAQSDGRSLVPALLENRAVKAGRIYGEYDVGGGGMPRRVQQQYVREGDFVALRYHKDGAPVPTQLYNVMADPHQDNDLAADPRHAERLAQMQALLLTCRRPCANTGENWAKTVIRPYDKTPLPALPGAKAGPYTVRLYPGEWPWAPQFDALDAARTLTLDTLDFDAILAAAKPPCGISVTGLIDIPETGAHNFTVRTAHGAHVWLHEARLFALEAAHDGTASIPLAKGLHPIRIDFTLAPAATPTFALEISK
ncbi:MAG: sulfatase-like hydrolase/transferase [Kiritimatiellaeota bacterium]|nr:sulfatase-like hydrolase/transferase [Kiritimatiellota bacterium]